MLPEVLDGHVGWTYLQLQHHSYAFKIFVAFTSQRHRWVAGMYWPLQGQWHYCMLLQKH